MDRRNLLISGIAGVGAAMLSAPALAAATKTASTAPTVELLLQRNGCGKFGKLLQKAGALQLLRKSDHTLFALTDSGIEHMPQDYLAKMTSGDVALLQFVTGLHMVDGLYTYDDLMSKPGKLVAVSGTDLTVTPQAVGPTINGVPIQDLNLKAPHVIVHPVARLLLPS